MAIRQFRCGHTRTIQPYKDSTKHKINGDCPGCAPLKYKLVNVGDRDRTITDKKSVSQQSSSTTTHKIPVIKKVAS